MLQKSDGKCILRIGLIDDETNFEDKDLTARKTAKVAEKAEKDNFFLEGAILPFLHFSKRSA